MTKTIKELAEEYIKTLPSLPDITFEIASIARGYFHGGVKEFADYLTSQGYKVVKEEEPKECGHKRTVLCHKESCDGIPFTHFEHCYFCDEGIPLGGNVIHGTPEPFISGTQPKKTKKIGIIDAIVTREDVIGKVNEIINFLNNL